MSRIHIHPILNVPKKRGPDPYFRLYYTTYLQIKDKANYLLTTNGYLINGEDKLITTKQIIVVNNTNLNLSVACLNDLDFLLGGLRGGAGRQRRRGRLSRRRRNSDLTGRSSSA